MKKIILLATSFLLGMNFSTQAKSLPGEKLTLALTTVEFINVDKDGNITRNQTVHTKKIIPHAKENEQVDKKELIRLAQIAAKKRQSLPKGDNKDATLFNIFDEAADFIDHAKAGIGSVLGSAAGFVSGLVADEAVGIVGGILVP